MKQWVWRGAMALMAAALLGAFSVWIYARRVLPQTEGALRVQDEVPGAVTIFVKAPSFAELERRLRERATESAGEIGVRLAVARRQLALEGRFDHVIVNDDLERAVDEVEEIVRRALDGAGTMATHDPSPR